MMQEQKKCCGFNCYPIDPHFRLIVVASTNPYAVGVVFWEVFNETDQIVKKYDNLTIFHSSSASRLFRLDGTKCLQDRLFSSNINITATMFFGAFQLRAEEVSRCVNIGTVVGSFRLVHPQPSVYRYKTSGPIERNVLLTYRVYSFSSKLKWLGYVTEVQTSITDELVFTSRGNRIQLCIADINHAESCSRPSRVHVSSKRIAIEMDQVKKSVSRGHTTESLSDVFTYMLANVVSESDSYGMVVNIRWNFTMEERWELLQVISQVRGLTGPTSTLQDKLSALNLISNYFLSETGGSFDGLPTFIEDPKVGVDFVITVLWMEIRNIALELLIDVVSSIAAISWKYRRDYRLNTTPNGDSLVLMVRGFALIHHQRIEILFSEFAAVRNDIITWKWLAGEVAYWGRQNSRSELKLLLNICNHFSGVVIPFHGLRMVGNDDMRFYAVSSSYFGIVNYFNKSRTKEENFPGHTDFIFGPYNSSTDSRSSWLQFVRVLLPSVDWNSSSVFSLVVYTAKNIKNDLTISPELYVHLTERNGEGPLLSKLPSGQQIAYSLPFMWEGEVGHQRTSLYFFTNETIVKLGSRNSEKPWRNMLAFRARLSGKHEEYAFSILQIDPPPPWALQVKIFYVQPDYEEFTPADSVPQCQGDCAIEADNSTKYVRNGSFSLLEIILRPSPGKKYLPKIFYLGIVLPESVSPGVYTIGIKSVLTECTTEDLATAIKETCATQAIHYGDTTVTCKCNRFGRIRTLPNVLVRHRIFTDHMPVVGTTEAIDAVRVASFVFSGIVVLSAVLLLVFAVVRDRRRTRMKHFAFNYTLDSYPGKAGILIVGIITGLNPLAGTYSSVAVKIFGTVSESRVHVLQSRRKKHFAWMGDDWFIIPLEAPLGSITHINLWHDFQCSSDWYCARILILEFNVHRWYVFEINRWFKLRPSDEESSMASFTPLVPSGTELVLPTRIHFGSYYTREMKNTHVPGSLFHLHPRYVGTYEQQCLMFLVKLFAIIFLTWASAIYDIFGVKVDPRLGHTTRITWPTVCVTFCIAFGSHAFTLPGHIIYRCSVKSWSLQKRTTHRAVHFTHHYSRDDHTSSDHVRGHPPSDLSSDRVVHKKRNHSRASPSSNPSHESVDSQPLRPIISKNWWRRVSRRISMSYTPTPQKPKISLAMVLFGPCQYWAINANVEEARYRMRCVNVMARSILGGFSVLMCIYCLYTELFTPYWHYIQHTCFFVVMALLADAVVVEPFLIFVKVLLAFSVFGVNDADLQMWTHRSKIRDLPQPRPYSPDVYLKLVTQSQYHPLTSVQLDAKRNEQNLLLMMRWSFYYILVSILAYSTYRQVSWERHLTTWAYLEATHLEFEERFRHHSSTAVGIADVVDNKTAVQYLVQNYVSNEAYDLFASGKPISKNGSKITTRGVWGRDSYSSPTGVTNVIMLQSTNQSRRPVITEEFKPYFQSSWYTFDESIPETGPITVGLETREYKESFTDYAIKSQSITGKSGESYPFKGQTWHYQVVPWANYYSDFRDDLETLFFKERKHRLHALIVQTNYFCPYMPGISTVIIVVEKLPNGMTSALMHTQFIKVGDFDDSKSKYPALFYRTLNCVLFVFIFWFNVFLMCKLGLDTYFAEFQWIVKWLLMCTCCVNSYMAAYQYYRRFQTFDHVVDSRETFVNVYGLTAVDSTVLASTFLLVSVEAVLLLHWFFNLTSLRMAFGWCAKIALVGMVYEASRLKMCDLFLLDDTTGLSLLISVYLKEARKWVKPIDEFLQIVVSTILLSAAYACFWLFKSTVIYKVLRVGESPKRATGFDECAATLSYIRHRLCTTKPSHESDKESMDERGRSESQETAASKSTRDPSQWSQTPEIHQNSLRAKLSEKFSILR